MATSVAVVCLTGCGATSASSDPTTGTTTGTTSTITTGSTTTGSTTTGSTTTGQTTRTTHPATPPPAPKAGTCRDLTYSDIGLYANSDKAVTCAKPHTAYTFTVAQLPSDIAFAGVQVKNDAIQNAAARLCRTAFAGYVGGSAADRALSRLTPTYFLPEQQWFDAGAHWVRCDIVALQASNALGDLPDKLKGVLNDAATAKKYGVCMRNTPGTPDAILVMCTQSHDYRALAAIRLGKADAPYPGDAAFKAGDRQCKTIVSNALGVTGGFTYAWTYPSTSDWSGGQRFGYCWDETSH